MSELNVASLFDLEKVLQGRSNKLFYSKSEADKALKDLEESHKKEVEQLLMEIVELKEALVNKKEFSVQCQMAARTLQRKLRHHAYKRCLDKADLCKARYDEEDAKVNGCGASWEYISKEMKYWERWHKRWLKIAEQFKKEI